MTDSQAQQRSARVDETLQTLFGQILELDSIDPADIATRQSANDLINKAKVLVHDQDGSMPADVLQAQDLIKRKLLRENSSPEKAAKFSNLYSRLLGIEVLSQKWAMLYLLYALADSQPVDLSHLDDSDIAPSIVAPSIVANPQGHLSATRRRQSVPLVDRTTTYSRDNSVEPPERTKFTKQNYSPRQRSVPQQESARPEYARETNGVDHVTAEAAPTESDLLRDLPFNLQGLSSTGLEFIATDMVRLPKNLPIPILSLLYALAEPCLLYKGLAEFTTSHSTGLLTQSLAAAISQELRSYLGLVAALEGEIRRALTALGRGDEDLKAIRTAGVTLKRCVVWTHDATIGLRLMSVIVDDSKQKRGGQIISLIHNLSSSHGDPFVGTFADRLLGHVARPFYEMLKHWIYDGELVDPSNEFFVVEADPSAKADVDPRRIATSIWEDKYILDNDMIPSNMSPEFAKKVFLIGKSLNFIRNNCGDSDWVIQYSQTHSKSLDYANTSSLSSSIDVAYQTTMSRLTYLMSTKFLLFTHLEAIKKYLLLSQGDFIELLVESLAPNLDRPAYSQYRHTLTSQLEHAIRHSNAQYEDPEVLGRLDARMLELGRGDTGWDCFTLEYKISAPCDVVITQWASTQYLKIFNLLLRVKRVEYSLNQTWRRCMTGARGVLGTVDDKLGDDWKKARCSVAEMVHFVNQLQYYILFEVIEASWKDLQEAMKKPNATLDDLIEAHTKYVKTITQKGLLSNAADREEAFLVQLHHILRCMLHYREAVDGLYSYSVAEFTKRQQFSAKIEQRTAAGKWGITEKDTIGNPRPASSTHISRPGRQSALLASEDADSPIPLLANAADDVSLLVSLRSRLLQLSTEFRSRISVLLYDLAHQPDVDMRFLGVVMNFNEVYRPVNRRRRDREREKKDADRKDREPSTSYSVAASNVDGRAATVEDGDG